MTNNRNMDIDTYLDQSKNLLDVYIRNNDYKKTVKNQWK